jgi:hypothetical protein
MKKIIVLILGIVVFAGCKKNFLERSSLVTISQDNFWRNASDAQLGVNGIFDVLQTDVLYSGGTGNSSGLPLYDNFTDNSFNGYKYQGPGEYVEGRTTPTTAYFSASWNANFQGIARANEAIYNIEKMDAAKISDAARKLLLGQAYFLRALFYFNVAVYFRDAPLIIKPQTYSEASVPKNTQQEILAQIVLDLEFANVNLPVNVTPEQYGYATKGAAFGLLARVQLFNKNWTEAAAAAKSVIDLAKYDVNTPYTTIFSEAGEFTKEIVFSVRFQEAAGFNTGEDFAGTFTAIPKINAQPMPNVVKDYYCTDGKPITQSPLYKTTDEKASRDPRLLASVYFTNDIFLTDIKSVFKGNTSTKYGLKKYTHTKTSPLGTGPAGKQSQDYYILRYADILLMRAEALIESGDTGPEVYSLINQVRARVGMPTIQAVEGSNLNTIKLRDILRHERRVELAFEGLRFYDLIRWGTVQDAYTRMIADKIVGYIVNYRGLRSEVFPIPQAELDANTKLVQIDPWK